MTDDANDRVVPVTIKNWADSIAKPRYARKTILKTWVLDTANLVGSGTWQQIADFEPMRCRLVIEVIDNPIVLTTDTPTGLVTSTNSIAPNGRHLPVSSNEKEFFGPDAFWIAIVGPGPATTRVTVTKEYE
jgi:hypothetical protein